MKYGIIYADPPWRYNDKGCQGNCESHYSTMSVADICRLPVKGLADNDCVLFLWATCPMLTEAMEVIKAWGFKYKTIGFQWVKQNRGGQGYFFGLGHWTRGNTEVCLLATKGHPRRISNRVSQLIMEPIQRHSQKPSCVRDKIVELMGDLPRVELFARQSVDGWECWGDEVNSTISFAEEAEDGGEGR